MSGLNEENRRRILAGVCLAGLALFLLTNPFTQLMARGARAASVTAIALAGFVTPIQMALMIGSVFGIVQLLRKRADRAGLIGGTLALMGWTAGTRINVVNQLDALLQTGVSGLPGNALEKMFEAAPIVWVSIVPVGLMFPIGLITLGVTLFVAHPVSRWIGALLAVGGVLFPVGRAVGIEWAWSACDLVLGATFALIGWQILTRPELWRGEAAEREEEVVPIFPGHAELQRVP
ncbi:MAG TPA: hypothetical protein VEK57_23865 [Thermoanaerobaculia bacterium]|nr:hypothetical protein [Thermoanaerobaculia bacterium]